MREMIRIAMLDAGGYNSDAMWAAGGRPGMRNDPFVFAPLLKGLSSDTLLGTACPASTTHRALCWDPSARPICAVHSDHRVR